MSGNAERYSKEQSIIFWQQIKKVQQEFSLSKLRIAELSGCTHSAVRCWERGCKAKRDDVAMFSANTGIPVDWLLGKSDQKLEEMNVLITKHRQREYSDNALRDLALAQSTADRYMKQFMSVVNPHQLKKARKDFEVMCQQIEHIGKLKQLINAHEREFERKGEWIIKDHELNCSSCLEYNRLAGPVLKVNSRKDALAYAKRFGSCPRCRSYMRLPEEL